MKPVIQKETTGCAIASAAAIAGLSYEVVKAVANEMAIRADDPSLWSETAHVRRLLNRLGFPSEEKEKPFTGWETLPDCALLAIKWHLEKGKPFWHRVVFIREDGRQYVLDSKATLKNKVRTDFGRMKPKWFIEVEASS
ncbi:hypothetical protein [Solemya velesiana gill symbiont]|uniref:Peptidase C39 domain-containing protein n=1 Tax=Solemya velesiana gill symbiont TaxID=1918948 RepID=A0A1T2KY95_9GAMM|nr:hypothetical protein [Solemya velesiana gill symbiont]OOZ37815.1 hypothetical protein BOW51_00700 [Solemya velesiana gill symbiont]